MAVFGRSVAVSGISLAMMLAAQTGAPAQEELDEVSFGTNWLAQAEHGGYYQAIADGTYEEYGLDVTIRQGGPQGANRALLTGGQIDFYMGGVSSAINAVKEGIPTITLAAIFQKDPQVLIAHPDQGFDEFADLANASQIIMGNEGLITYFEWMKANYEGFSDEQYAPYTFNPAPFLADKMAVQQGYLTSEPFEIERQAGFTPKVFLLADEGYDPYSTTIEAMKPFVDENPDVAQRFVEASIIGWYNYLYGDNAAANELIKADNPEMTDEQLAYSLEKMKEYGIVISGEAEEQGIGCMTDERWTSFYEEMVGIGLFEEGIDISQAYTTEYVCKGLGVELAAE
jgi:NitT/TauT family transport system substrate-binding protein